MNERQYNSAADQIALEAWKEKIDHINRLSNELKQCKEKYDVLEQQKQSLYEKLQETQKQVETARSEAEIQREELEAAQNILGAFGFNNKDIIGLYNQLSECLGRQRVLVSLLVLYVQLARRLLDVQFQHPVEEKKQKAATVVDQLDRVSFEVLKSEWSMLNRVRAVLRAFFERDDLLARYFRIEWPNAGDRFDDNVHRCSESDRMGNVIKIAKTCVLRDASGIVLRKSEVVTEYR